MRTRGEGQQQSDSPVGQPDTKHCIVLESKITNLTTPNQQLETQRNNLTKQIQDLETNWNKLNVSRAQWSIDAYCPKDKG
ncbi:hypothetical protein FQN60_018814, partial [Etheostoma spectabile]